MGRQGVCLKVGISKENVDTFIKKKGFMTGPIILLRQYSISTKP